MLYNIFCIFIGVTFANLGRERVESGKMRNLICYRTKENNYTNKNAPTYHKPVHQGKLEHGNETNYLRRRFVLLRVYPPSGLGI